jgi:hypothetical protein
MTISFGRGRSGGADDGPLGAPSTGRHLIRRPSTPADDAQCWPPIECVIRKRKRSHTAPHVSSSCANNGTARKSACCGRLTIAMGDGQAGTTKTAVHRPTCLHVTPALSPSHPSRCLVDVRVAPMTLESTAKKEDGVPDRSHLRKCCWAGPTKCVLAVGVQSVDVGVAAVGRSVGAPTQTPSIEERAEHSRRHARRHQAKHRPCAD